MDMNSNETVPGGNAYRIPGHAEKESRTGGRKDYVYDDVK